MAAEPSTMTERQKGEVLCSYAALLLHGCDQDVSADNISKAVKACGGKCEIWQPGMFEQALAGIDIKDLLTAVGTPSAGGAGPAAAAGGAAEAAKEPEPEPEPESDEEMGFDLFG